MKKNAKNLLKGIIHMMWADGSIDDYERELVGRMMVELKCSHDDIQKMSEMMKTPPTEEFNFKNEIVTPAEREEFYRLAAAMAVVDGHLAASEKELLNKIAANLEINKDKAQEILESVKEQISSVTTLRED
ncbi:TerB family tellurite resistance protein [bacterium]|nr:TerB family tellurite resistance protein [bacterium]